MSYDLKLIMYLKEREENFTLFKYQSAPKVLPHSPNAHSCFEILLYLISQLLCQINWEKNQGWIQIFI